MNKGIPYFERIFLNSGFLNKSFKLVCIFLAGYMSIFPIIRYFENKDTSTIEFKKFNVSPLDLYPVLTVCFLDDKSGTTLYNKEYLQEDFGLTQKTYIDFLRGDVNHHTSTLNPNNTDILTLFDVDIKNATLRFRDVIKWVQFEGFYNSTAFSPLYTKESKRLAFYLSYQDPLMMCISRNNSFEKGVVRTQDSIRFERAFSPYGITIHVHGKGQLMSHLGKPVYRNEQISSKVNIRIDLTSTTVLRKRPDSNEPCNPSIEDDDEMIRFLIMKEVGCYPVYWKPIQPTSSRFNYCNSTMQMAKMRDQIKNFRSLMNKYNGSCTAMKLGTSVQTSKIPNVFTSGVTIDLVYNDDDYVQISNTKDFGFEMLWIGIGGFVGLFLGVSLSQFPGVLSAAIRTVVHPIDTDG